MKREERKTLNYLKKTVDHQTLNVGIPTSYSHEARQSIHEMLTIAKHFTVKRIEWNDILNEYCIAYSSERSQEERQSQENRDIDDITKNMPKSDYTWNGHLKPGTDPDEDITTAEPEPATAPDPEPETLPIPSPGDVLFHVGHPAIPAESVTVTRIDQYNDSRRNAVMIEYRDSAGKIRADMITAFCTTCPAAFSVW